MMAGKDRPRQSEGDKILICCNDPKGQFEKIFDGYRRCYELLFYVANIKGINVFPDWYWISDNNHMNSKSYWGVDPEIVRKNMIASCSKIALIYQETKTELDPKWFQNNFIKVAEFDWGGSAVMTELNGENIWESQKPAPKWFLIQQNEENS